MMNDQDALIARAHAGKRVAEFLADPEVSTAWREAVENLKANILALDPKDQQGFTIAKAMLIGIQELWGALSGIVARGKDAEAIMDGKAPVREPGRVL